MKYNINNSFRNSLKIWANRGTSSTIIIKGRSNASQQERDFATDLICCIQASHVPVIWAIEAKSINAELPHSAVDVLKYLAHQILTLQPTGLPINLNPVSFQIARTESEWFSLLVALVSMLSQVFIVLDLSLLGDRLPDEKTWVDAFEKLFNEIQVRGNTTLVKVVFINDDTASSGLTGHVSVLNMGTRTRGRAVDYDSRAGGHAARRKNQKTIHAALRRNR